MTRSCGNCDLCCRLMRIDELGKPPHQRCPHMNGRGCGIYEGRPPSCRAFACGWLMGKIGSHLKPTRVNAVVHGSQLITKDQQTTIDIIRITCDDRKKLHRDIIELRNSASHRMPIIFEYRGWNQVWQDGEEVIRIREGEYFSFDWENTKLVNIKKVSSREGYDELVEVAHG